MANNVNALDELFKGNPKGKLNFMYRIALADLIQAVEEVMWKNELTHKTALQIVTQRYRRVFCFLYCDWGINKQNSKQRLNELNFKITAICEKINSLSPFLKFECVKSMDLTNGGTVQINRKSTASFSHNELKLYEIELLRYIKPSVENHLQLIALGINSAENVRNVALNTFLSDIYGFEFYLPYRALRIDEDDTDRLNQLINITKESLELINFTLNLHHRHHHFELLTAYDNKAGAMIQIIESSTNLS